MSEERTEATETENTVPDAIERALEATLFASEEPMTVDALADHLGGLDKQSVRERLKSLTEQYQSRGVHLVERGKRWHFETAPDLAHLLRREKEQVRRLSRAATEVLAIVAYHEPVSRAEIESIRGVQTSGGTLDVLMEAGWIKLAGRRDVPGRPVIYATTPEFLDHFGLVSRRDLPGMDELRASGLLDPVDDAFEEAMGAADEAAEADQDSEQDSEQESDQISDDGSEESGAAAVADMHAEPDDHDGEAS
ncbi:MAG: SMC-Scp complex subunit ScpB [Erythrobacter sp.]